MKNVFAIICFIACLFNYSFVSAPENEIRINEVTLTSKPYMAVHATAGVKDIGFKLGNAYGKIIQEMQQQGLKQTGSVFAIYYSDSDKNFDFDAAIPVDKIGTSTEEVKAGLLSGGKAVVAQYHGAYEGTSAAHKAIINYLKKLNKKPIGPCWEEYVTDPMAEPDTAKWLTNVYYPYK